MKRLIAATALAMFGLAPALATACDYEAMAPASAAEKLGLAPGPAATKAPSPTVAKAPVSTATRQLAVRDKGLAPPVKLVATSSS